VSQNLANTVSVFIDQKFPFIKKFVFLTFFTVSVRGGFENALFSLSLPFSLSLSLILESRAHFYNVPITIPPIHAHTHALYVVGVCGEGGEGGGGGGGGGAAAELGALLSKAFTILLTRK